jgi:two-component system chemotaxis response regulator CheY
MTKVLLIDDDEDVHALIREQIRISDLKDIDLVSALSGSEGAKKYIDEGANVVIMDLKMPKGDGVFATKRIIKHDPDAKIFIMTAYPSSSDVSTSIDCGALGVIKKAGQFAALVIAFIIAISQGVIE